MQMKLGMSSHRSGRVAVDLKFEYRSRGFNMPRLQLPTQHQTRQGGAVTLLLDPHRVCGLVDEKFGHLLHTTRQTASLKVASAAVQHRPLRHPANGQSRSSWRLYCSPPLRPRYPCLPHFYTLPLLLLDKLVSRRMAITLLVGFPYSVNPSNECGTDLQPKTLRAMTSLCWR